MLWKLITIVLLLAASLGWKLLFGKPREYRYTDEDFEREMDGL